MLTIFYLQAVVLLHDAKQYLLKTFYMPNLGEAYNFLFGIKIVRDSICGLVKFS